jgi:DNA recombination protein RmuC
VDFAVRFPGRSDDGTPVWLPIDAKFPRDDYERLLEAHDRADAVGVEACARALEARIRQEAKSIAESYVSPPHTTDFAILFLPVESLYAEVLRRPGLIDALQRDWRVTLAGPTTLLAMLNSLHMGFRTLALQEQASEVWKVLGAVKTEFERYGDWVARIKEQMQKASDTLDKADTRTRQMRRALKVVEALPETQAQGLLPSAEDVVDDAAE